MNSLLTSLNGGLGSLLLAGALIGGALAACDPKVIGNESAGDVVCQMGETKPAGDGCNTCTCDGGDWACTLKACDEPVCEDGDTKEAEDGCNTCGCVEGQWACTLIDCGATTTAGMTSGEPGTSGEPMPACQEGDKKEAEDGCNTCECYEGKWACTEEACPQTTGEPGVCGDGQLDAGEQCDDGNVASGDGCDENCAVEGSGAIAICQEPFPKDPLVVKSAVIDGDSLLVGVEFGGGCEEHVLGYCWDGSFAESEPEQVFTQISHESFDDPCDALLSKQLKFDLVPLKTVWQEGHQQQSGEIIVHVEGAKEALSYKF
jgi:cysteine-rich repeat protein